MADNVPTEAVDDVGATFATDDIGGVHHPRTKIVHGINGVNDGDVAVTNPLPVQLRTPSGVSAMDEGTGSVRVAVVDGATEYFVNNVVPADPEGPTLLAERDDQLATLAETEGDWTNVRATSKGALWVAIPDSSGNPITSFGGGTEYTEDAALPTDPTGPVLVARYREPSPLSNEAISAEGDAIVLNASRRGELYVDRADKFQSATLAGLDATVELEIDGMGAVTWEVDTGTLVGTLVFEATLDGTTWSTALVYRAPGVSSVVSAITSFGDRGRFVSITGWSKVRMRVAAFTSGSSNARLEASAGGDASLALCRGIVGHDDALVAVGVPPVAIGGRASTAAPSAVGSDGDAVYLWADPNGRLSVGGQVAHDTAVAGNPVVIGGRGSDAVPTNVDADGDAVRAWFNQWGATIVAGPVSQDSPVSQSTNRPVMAGFRASSAVPTAVSADGDAVFGRALPNGALVVSLVDQAGHNLNDESGDALRVNVVAGSAGGTEYTEDIAAPADPQGGTLMMTRDDQLSTVTEAEGDWSRARGTSKGALWVAMADSSGDPITSFGGGTQYTEDAAAAANPTGTALNLVRADTPAAVTDADGDNVAARGTNKGEMYVKHIDPIPVTDNSGSLTVDNPALSVVGGGTEATAQRVTIASDSTGVLSVDDNGSSLTVDGTVSVSGAVDTELPAAATLGDNTANPTTTSVGSFPHWWDPAGANWDRAPGNSVGGAFVQGPAAHDAAVAGNPVLVGAYASAAAPTEVSADGEAVRIWASRRGEQLVTHANRIQATTFSAVDAAATISAEGISGVSYQVGSGLTGTIVFEATIDDTNWFAIDAFALDGSVITSLVNPPASRGFLSTPAYSQVRMRVSAYTSGSPVGRLEGTIGQGPIEVARLRGTVAVGGDVAHDAADSGNPVKVGAKAANALQTAVANGDRTNLNADLFGRLITAKIDPAQQIHINKTYTSQQTGTDVWDPTAGKKIAITSIIIGSYGSAEFRVHLWFGDNADTTFTQDTDQVAFAASFVPGNSYPGAVVHFDPPCFCTTADRELHITTSAAGSLDLTIEGYEW